MEVKLGIRIKENNRHVYGDGRQVLLEKIEQLGSIRQAALEMGMSYRAAWGKIKATEEGLGIKLLDKQIGGSKGGGAVLTVEGKKLVRAYAEFREGLDESVNRKFSDKLRDQGLLIV